MEISSPKFKVFSCLPTKKYIQSYSKKGSSNFFPEPTIIGAPDDKSVFSFGSEPMYVSDVWSPNLDLLDTQIGSCRYTGDSI